MDDDSREYKYHAGKIPRRTYVSKRVVRKSFNGDTKKVRAISKVFDIPDFKEYIKNKKQVVLNRTGSSRQELKAWVEEDSREFQLMIQRFQVDSGVPWKNTCIGFTKHSLKALFDFVQSL